MEEPWFTYWVRPGGKRQIVPRNLKGWFVLASYVLLVSGVSLLLAPLLARTLWMLAPYLTAVGLLTFGFIRFALARSERVEVDLTPAELAEYRAWKKRGKR